MVYLRTCIFTRLVDQINIDNDTGDTLHCPCAEVLAQGIVTKAKPECSTFEA